MITSGGLNKAAKAIDSIIGQAGVLINGSTKRLDVQKTEINNGVIKKHVYLDETYVGKITRVRLYDTDGSLFSENVEDITKDAEKGFLYIFEYEVKEV